MEFRTAFRIPKEDGVEIDKPAHMNVQVPRELREAFYRECKKRKTSMRKAIIAFMYGVLKGDKIPEHPDDVIPSSYDESTPVVTREG